MRDYVRRIEQKKLNCDATVMRNSADPQGVLDFGWLFTAVQP